MAEARKKTRVTKAYKPGRSCPKCGAGNKLAKHEAKGQKPRFSCGKCGYTEII